MDKMHPSAIAELPKFFALLQERAEFRPVAEVTLEEAVRLVTHAIHSARVLQTPRLLVDIRGLSGFKSPDVAQRYFIVRQWADAARRHVKMVVVARTELIDPEKFGVTVAANAGVAANIFDSEPEALEWLHND